MKKWMMAAAAVLAMMATSCIEHHVTIELNKDGSGTVVEETSLSAATIAMLEQMAAGLGGEGGEAPDPTADMMDKAAAEEKAKAMGEGVTLKSVEKIDAGGRKGAKITYAFEDINKVKYGFGDSLDEMGPGEAAGGEEKSEPIEFSYADGVLTVKNPNIGKAEEAAADEEIPEVDPGAMAQAQMLKGMKMSMKLKCAGGIAETNATHHEGDTVTLISMDMDKLLENPAAFAKLQKAQPESPAEMTEALQGVEGVKVDTNEELKVTLK